MAGLPMIETGYKPEFGLGALYQGFNAANADQSAQEELLKQFLANQREQSMQPLDIEKQKLQNQGTVFDNMVKELSGNQAQAQNNPTMLGNFAQAKDAGNQEAIRKNEVGQLLHPFVKEQVPIEQGAKTQQLGMHKDLSDYQRLLSTNRLDSGEELTASQRKMLQGKVDEITGLLSKTPEQAGKTALEQMKGENRLAETDLAGQWALRAAEARAKAAAGGGGGSNVPLKMIQSDVNNLEKQITMNTQQLTNQEFTQSVMKMPGGEQVLKNLQSHNEQLKAQLASKRAELQTALGQPTPQPSQATDTPPQKMTLSKLKEMYPNVSEDKLREGYKRKFGEDLQ